MGHEYGNFKRFLIFFPRNFHGIFMDKNHWFCRFFPFLTRTFFHRDARREVSYIPCELPPGAFEEE